MAISRRSSRGGRFTDINVTPLVDVMLVLLIVFMVTAPLLSASLPVNLPQTPSATAASSQEAHVEITVTRDGHVMLAERDVTSDLVGALREAMSPRGPLRTVDVRADRDARYGDVARVVAAAKLVGVAGLHLVVEPAASP
jgi:biopolymer transport protein TolR